MATTGNNPLLKNFFSLGFVQVINSLLQLLVIPYVINKTGIENFGVVAVAQVVMFYMATFTDYGFNQTATREVSLNRDNNELLGRIFARVYYTKALLCVIAFVMLLLLALVFPFIRHHFLLYCMAFLFVPGYASQPVWFLQGVERMQLLAFITLASRLIFVALVFLFIQAPEHASLFIFFLGVGNLAGGIAGAALVFRLFKLKHYAPSFREVLHEIKTGWPLTVTNLSMNVIQYGNLFILRLFTNDIVAGYFSVAERIYFTMKHAFTVFSQAVYPRVCQLAAGSPQQLKAFLRRVFVPFWGMIVAGSTLVFIFSPVLIHYFAKEESPDAVFILRMLCLVMPVIALNIPATLTLLALDRRRTCFVVYASAMVLNVMANLVLAYFFAAKGTIAAIFITELFIVAGVWLSVWGYWSVQLSSSGNRL